jgi:hypothetical protein
MAMGQIIGILLRKAAEGDFGPTVKAAYDLFDGHKTRLGLVAGAFGAVLAYLDQSGACTLYALNCHGWATQWGTVLLVLGGLGIHVGQVGGALKLEPPRK